MSTETLTYSPSGQGWTSRWSYRPEMMLGMNNTFYTWKNGQLYKHDSNSVRNQFYIEQDPPQGGNNINYNSSITTIFNQDPTEAKVFKTLELESNDTWTADIATDLNTGQVDYRWFVEKEGGWFGHIRRDASDLDHKSISTQGIGQCQTYSSLVITFGFGIGNSVSQGDTIYKLSGGSLVEVGDVDSHDFNSITLVSALSAPSPGDFIVYVKNSVAESYGARGSWMEVTLTNDSTSEVEIFEVSTNVFKSFP